MYDRTQRSKRVVVTGMGIITSLGLTLEENWRKATAGISGISKIRLPGAERCPIQAVGAVSETDWKALTTEFQNDAAIDGERRIVFALRAARSALADSDMPVGKTNFRAGVLFGAGLGIFRPEDIHRWITRDSQFDSGAFARELDNVRGESMIRNRPQRAAVLIGKQFGLGGQNTTVTSACASATQALGMAFRSIQRGEAEFILAGGADSMINPLGLLSFILLQAAETRVTEFSTACRPFDRTRAGLVMGEGAGAVILEEEAHARRRGARIYAEVAGYASSMDAYQITAPHPRGLGAALSMGQALHDADLEPRAIDYINAHGTGTRLNDITETLAIKEIFQEHACNVAISSSKSLIGHLMAAAGAPEFIFTAMSVHRDEIHPTINLKHPDPKCDLDYVPQVKRTRTVNAALSNSFGFGGQNASIVIKKYFP
jgi:3-oxoacyl-[acyl-carrier-protein] synthase II